MQVTDSLHAYNILCVVFATMHVFVLASYEAVLHEVPFVSGGNTLHQFRLRLRNSNSHHCRKTNFLALRYYVLHLNQLRANPASHHQGAHRR